MTRTIEYQPTAIAVDELVRVVHVPHKFEKRFTVRRLELFGAVIETPDPEAACAAVRKGLAEWLEGME